MGTGDGLDSRQDVFPCDGETGGTHDGTESGGTERCSRSMRGKATLTARGRERVRGSSSGWTRSGSGDDRERGELAALLEELRARLPRFPATSSYVSHRSKFGRSPRRSAYTATAYTSETPRPTTVAECLLSPHASEKSPASFLGVIAAVMLSAGPLPIFLSGSPREPRPCSTAATVERSSRRTR